MQLPKRPRRDEKRTQKNSRTARTRTNDHSADPQEQTGNDGPSVSARPGTRIVRVGSDVLHVPLEFDWVPTWKDGDCFWHTVYGNVFRTDHFGTERTGHSSAATLRQEYAARLQDWVQEAFARRFPDRTSGTDRQPAMQGVSDAVMQTFEGHMTATLAGYFEHQTELSTVRSFIRHVRNLRSNVHQMDAQAWARFQVLEAATDEFCDLLRNLNLMHLLSHQGPVPYGFAEAINTLSHHRAAWVFYTFLVGHQGVFLRYNDVAIWSIVNRRRVAIVTNDVVQDIMDLDVGMMSDLLGNAVPGGRNAIMSWGAEETVRIFHHGIHFDRLIPRRTPQAGTEPRAGQETSPTAAEQAGRGCTTSRGRAAGGTRTEKRKR